jgi:prepilin-type N-terminal cleavage/methylation domain-containing protein
MGDAIPLAPTGSRVPARQRGDPRAPACGPRLRGARGFTLFELVVCIVIISAAAAMLLVRLSHYQEIAERIAMESTVRLVKTGLQMRLAELIITHREAQAPVLEMANPVLWLEEKPANYGGAYRLPVRPGTWYFDERLRQLVYVVNTGNRLELDSGPGERMLRFRAKLVKDRLEMGGGPVEAVSGITVAAVTLYRWP